MIRNFGAILAVAMCAYAVPPEQSPPYRAWFEGGAGLEIYTVTTGTTTAKSPGTSIGIDRGGVFQTIIDSARVTLFAYRITAKRVEGSDVVSIRIEPDESHGGLGRTVQAVREFPNVKTGEAVTLDLLFNPATGEKVYDVLLPTAELPPSPPPVVTGSLPFGEQLSLRGITVRVNGQSIPGPNSWLISAGAKVYVPGYGLYVLAAQDPKEVLRDYAFQHVGQAEKDKLNWTLNGIRIEITSTTNILAKAERGGVWVHHDPNYRQPQGPEVVTLQAIPFGLGRSIFGGPGSTGYMSIWKKETK